VPHHPSLGECDALLMGLHPRQSAARHVYIGVTNNIPGRAELHKAGKGSRFTSRYGVSMLVYFEEFASIRRGGTAREDAEALLALTRRELKPDLNTTTSF